MDYVQSTSNELLIAAYIIYLIVYFIICTEIAATAEKKGLKYLSTILICFFATPIVGLLYILVQLTEGKQK